VVNEIVKSSSQFSIFRLLDTHTYTYPNTYALTKSLTEQLIHDYRDKMKIAIVRPAIITASHKEPFPGFIESLNGPTGVLAGCARGVIRSMHCNSNYPSELIPVDMTANCILACAWKRVQSEENEIFYCNITESEVHPLTFGEIAEMGLKFIRKHPLSLSLWYPSGSFKSNYYHHLFCVIFFHYLPAYFIDFLLILFRQEPFLVKVQRRVSQGLKVFQYYTTRKWNFKNANMLELHQGLSEKDKELFNFDLSVVNYEDYIENYVLGIRHYLFKEKPETLPKARKTLWKLYLLDKFCKALFLQ
jgi:fatty acyl-CoA reductase